MKHYTKDNKLIFETDKQRYVVVCQAELKCFEDYYVESEGGEAGLKNLNPIHKAYDYGYAGYYQYFVYKLGEETDFANDYVGEPSENFSVEWAEEQIKKYEER